MRTSALAAAGLGLATVVSGVAVAAPAIADPPAPPVVVDDAVAMYPYGMASVDVLANDTDPGDPDGSQLALCRLPSLDLSSILSNSSPVLVTEGDGILGKPGEMFVMLSKKRLAKPATVSYYVCNFTYLTPATLTVTTRPVADVSAKTVKGKPGWVKVTNHNDRRIRFSWLSTTAIDDESIDSEDELGNIEGVGVGAKGTRLIHVGLRKFLWVAAIGGAGNSGVADHGRLTDKRVHTKPGKKHHVKGDVLRAPGYVRTLFQRVFGS